jgi:hypothetical protein
MEIGFDLGGRGFLVRPLCFEGLVRDPSRTCGAGWAFGFDDGLLDGGEFNDLVAFGGGDSDGLGGFADEVFEDLGVFDGLVFDDLEFDGIGGELRLFLWKPPFLELGDILWPTPNFVR